MNSKDWLNQYYGLMSGGTTGSIPNIMQSSGSSSFPVLPMIKRVLSKTMGLTLVATKPITVPSIDLAYLDFKFDDVDRLLINRLNKINKITRKLKLEKILQNL